MKLTSDHIDYITKDLNYRGIVADEIQDELIDHICSAVETEMKNGTRFIEAYHKVLHRFGHNIGLRETQKKTLQFENQNKTIMFKNYLMIAFRNLAKHKFYTSINVFGLALGIASCLLIVLYVAHELSYDRYHEKANRIYRVNGEIKFGGNHYKLAVAPAPLAEALQHDYPEIEATVRFRNRGSYLVKRDSSADNFKELQVMWVDSSFFKVFTAPLLKGNANAALKDPNTVAISRAMAEKYFHNEEPLGQTLILDNDNRRPHKVTAVFENMPVNGHFRFDILISMAGLDEAKSTNFLSNNFNTYILLREGAQADAFEAKLPSMVMKYMGPQAAVVLGGEFTMEKFIASGNKLEYTLIPLTDIHLHSDLTAELGPNSDITYLYLFSAVALFILIIACINFMNLSTARSSNRAKEVGIRKVMGSMRVHLVRQFLSESVLLSLFAFGLAIVVAYLLLPYFNELSQKQLVLPFANPSFYLLVLAAALVVGVMAGLYPSFFLSAFEPVKVLKGQLSLGMKSGLIRSGLVVFQFSISIFLIIGTITVNRQFAYIQGKKIGFNKDQVIMVNDVYALGDQYLSFKNEVLKNSFISGGTVSGYVPVTGGWRSDNTFWPFGTEATQENMVGLQLWEVDYDYVKTMGMKILQGRELSEKFPSDSNAVVLNQTAVKHFNFEDNPVGKKISTFSNNNPDGTVDKNSLRSWEVIGVVEDFHFESLKQNISPLGLFLGQSRGYACFRFEATNTQDVIKTIEGAWKKIASGQPFEYSFLDEAFEQMYLTEQRLGKIFAGFAGLAIAIACLGLFALTSFTAEQRTKEIGIRKVLGASIGSIVFLLSKEFGKLIIISFVVAAPLAWWAVNKWLEAYQFKVEVGIMVYVLAAVSAFTIAWLTMAWQSFKAALSNPVNSLRSE